MPAYSISKNDKEAPKWKNKSLSWFTSLIVHWYIFSCQFFFCLRLASSFFCWHLTVDQRNMKERSGEDTCGKNYITINIRAHLSIISDVRHHRPRIHKIFPWRKLRIRIFLFCVEFCFFRCFSALYNNVEMCLNIH